MAISNMYIFQTNDVNQIKKISKNNYLKRELIKKMIGKFLTQTTISKEELAEKLAITKKQLQSLGTAKASLKLISKTNLPLIKLYCKTFKN